MSYQSMSVLSQSGHNLFVFPPSVDPLSLSLCLCQCSVLHKNPHMLLEILHLNYV